MREAAQLLKEENRGLEVKLSVIDIDIDKVACLPVIDIDIDKIICY